MNRQAGFTLIELIITVAIIAILAAISLPSYQTYVAKSQAAESISLLQAAKVNTEDSTLFLGQFPQTLIDVQSIQTQTTGSFGNITGTANTTNNGSTGDIIYKFNSQDINQHLKNESVCFSRDIDGQWSCSTTLSEKYAPKACTPNQIIPIGS